MGEVVQFPRARTCFACSGAGFTFDGVTICRDTGESIDSEVLAAAGCEGFELSDEGPIMVDDTGARL